MRRLSQSAQRLKSEVWPWLILSLWLVTVLLQGCVTQSQAREQARAAFIAGQQQAMGNLTQPLQPAARVTIIGSVQTPTIQWTPGLTLARAIVLADFQGPSEPPEIFIVRQGRAIRVLTEQLLKGKDVPLEAGDIVQLGRQ